MPVITHGDLRLAYGWDAPLEYFYLTVQRGDELLYSNCDDPDAISGTYSGGLTLTQLSTRLNEYGVTLGADDLDALSGTVRAASPRAPILTHLLHELNARRNEP
ncbi:hypothetical protein [Deinococcus sp. PEB2-63]